MWYMVNIGLKCLSTAKLAMKPTVNGNIKETALMLWSIEAVVGVTFQRIRVLYKILFTQINDTFVKYQ